MPCMPNPAYQYNSFKRFSIVRKIVYWLRNVRLSFCVYPPCIGAAPTGRISVEFDIGDSYEKYVGKIQIRLNRTKISDTLNEDLVAAGEINSPSKYCYATLYIFKSWQLTWSSATHTERIFAHANASLCYVRRTTLCSSCAGVVTYEFN